MERPNKLCLQYCGEIKALEKQEQREIASTAGLGWGGAVSAETMNTKAAIANTSVDCRGPNAIKKEIPLRFNRLRQALGMKVTKELTVYECCNPHLLGIKDKTEPYRTKHSLSREIVEGPDWA